MFLAGTNLDQFFMMEIFHRLALLSCVVLVASASSCDVDVCFAIDESSFLSAEAFDYQLEFVRGVANEMTRPTSDGSSPSWSLVKYGKDSSADDVLVRRSDHIDRLMRGFRNAISFREPGISVNMHSGLTRCRQVLADSTRHAKILMLTAGPPNKGPGAPDPERVKDSIKILSRKLVSSGFSLSTVGISKSRLSRHFDSDLLKNISSDFSLDLHFRDLRKRHIWYQVASELCSSPLSLSKLSTRQLELPRPSCDIDLCFAISASNKIPTGDLDLQLAFAGDLALSIHDRPSGPYDDPVRFSASIFDGSTNFSGGLIRPVKDPMDFLAALDQGFFANSDGATNLYAGLENCRMNLEEHARRRKVVLATIAEDPNQGPGAGNESETIERLNVLAADMRATGVDIYILGLQEPGRNRFIHPAKFEMIQSDPTYFSLHNYDDLYSIVDELPDVICAPRDGKDDDERCPCRLEEIPADPGLCSRPALGNIESNICFMEACQGNPKFVCDLSGDLKCAIKPNKIQVWKCTGVKNQTHCSCERSYRDEVVLEALGP